MSRLSAIALSLLSATLLAGAAHAQEGTVTVYTSQPTDQMNRVVEAFNRDHPQVRAEVFRSGTTELLAKLQAELAAGNPQADVLLIADAVAMTQLKNEDRLEAYPDAPVAGLPQEIVDPDHTFFGTKLITTGIVYNTELVETPPSSWADLLEEERAASLIMPSPLYSGAAVIHVGTVVQQPEFGWNYYEALADAGAVAGQGNGTVIEAVARGEKAYGILVEFMAMNAKANGSPVDFVFPQEGVSTITQPVAIVKGTDNLEAAKAFVDWQIGRAAQEQSVEQGYFPVLDGVEPPAGYPAVSDLTILPVDTGRLLADDQEIKTQFSDIFGG